MRNPDIGSEGENVSQTAARLALAAGATLHTNPIPGGLPFMTLPLKDGEQAIVYLDPAQRLPPPRVARTAQVWDVDSFLQYWAAFGNEHSRIYATRSEMAGILDEHVVDDASVVHAEFCSHKVVLPMTFSRRFKKWIEHNGRKNAFTDTESLAEFIEDTVQDYANPTAADMLEMAVSFKVDQTARYDKKINTSNGVIGFNYTVDNKTDGSKIPQRFAISVPIYEGPTQPDTTIEAYFRYRLSDGKLTIWYDLIQQEERIDEAFLALVKRVGEEVDTGIILGKV